MCDNRRANKGCACRRGLVGKSRSNLESSFIVLRIQSTGGPIQIVLRRSKHIEEVTKNWQEYFELACYYFTSFSSHA